MDDLISRKALISHIENQSREWGEDYDAQQILGDIEDMPPVNPQPNTGHWIEKMDACECPYCHKAWDYYDNDTEDFEYCPKCGAKLSENPTGSEPQEREDEE